MKKSILFLFVLIPAWSCFAQNKIFDLVSYTAPKNEQGRTWKEETNANSTVYTTVNKKDGSWCRIWIVKSTVGKGSIDADFENEWQELIVKNYHPTEIPQSERIEDLNGWKVKTGTAKFEFNNSTAIVMLTTASGFERCVSTVISTNSQGYLNSIQGFLESVQLLNNDSPTTNLNTQIGQTNSTSSKMDGFQFYTSNFDDGWASTVQEDWVEVKKGDIKVLLHYPKEGTVFSADPEPLTNAAWNILVAPRYRDLKNYRTAYITTYMRPLLGMGYAIEQSSDKEVFVLLFRQGGGWMEFITPDKKTFVQQFKFDPEAVWWDTETDLMKPLAQMSNYNRFAVAASDFKGKWTSNFSGALQMYNLYSGNYAGMNVHQNNIVFDFRDGNSYHWKLLAVNGMVGNMKYDQVESSGTFSVPNNWQLQCSKIEKGPVLYHAFWSCIKGGRVLNLLETTASGSGGYTQFGLAK